MSIEPVLPYNLTQFEKISKSPLQMISRVIFL
jgi:hypothetical protein